MNIQAKKPKFLFCLGLILMLAAAQSSWAQAFTKAGQCVVGTRVVNRDGQAGVITSADGSSCRVKLDATGKTDYNIFWMLKPESSSGKPNKASTAGDGAIPDGTYKCYMSAGTTLNYAFIDIHINGKQYRDKSGKRGSYTVAEGGKIVFTGPLSSANAKLLPGPRIGLNMNGGTFYNTSCSPSR